MVFLSLFLIHFLLLFFYFLFLILDFYFLYLLMYSSLQICRISFPPTCWVFIRIFPSILISNKPFPCRYFSWHSNIILFRCSVYKISDAFFPANLRISLYQITSLSFFFFHVMFVSVCFVFDKKNPLYGWNSGPKTRKSAEVFIHIFFLLNSKKVPF